jgi:hypothetical protein
VVRDRVDGVSARVLPPNVAAMTSKRDFTLGSWSRDLEGCIATFDRDGERWVRHFSQRGYVQAAADYADAHEAKIVTLSTPETIWRDLQGTRAPLFQRRGPQTGVEKQIVDRVDVPELSMLGKIGRRDLLLGWKAQPKHG